MSFEWELVESGPVDADHTVLLLPGGLNRARSYDEVMAQPALAGLRLVAATLPGNGGAPPPDDFSIETASRLAADLATELHCDAVVGFSTGATVALEMVASSAWTGPVVLLGISLSLEDEAAFLPVLDRLAAVFGTVPYIAMRRMFGMVTKQAHVSAARRAELTADLRKNDPASMRRIFRGYLAYLRSHPDPAARLCSSEVPAWIVHAEKGDGDLTDDERRDLEACPHATVVTIPGASFFLPNDEPERVAEYILAALAHT